MINREGEEQFPNALAQSSRDYRKRRERLSLQLNMFEWLVEIIGQWIEVPIFVLAVDRMFILQIVALFGLSNRHIIIPFIRLLTETRIKTIILRSGWSIAIKAVIECKQNTVAPQPADNIEMGSLGGSRNESSPEDDLQTSSPDNDGNNSNTRGTLSLSTNPSSSRSNLNRRDTNITGRHNNRRRDLIVP